MTENFLIVVRELTEREISTELVLFRQGFGNEHPSRHFVKLGKGIQLIKSRLMTFLFYGSNFLNPFFHIGKAKTDLLPAFTKDFWINVIYFCYHKFISLAAQVRNCGNSIFF